ncbi:hypothetical protein J6590_011444 [Homalodisca vitripennis]|nr:hypothetical protein J6590_011444 [Homalodisca vitripennis]
MVVTSLEEGLIVFLPIVRPFVEERKARRLLISLSFRNVPRPGVRLVQSQALALITNRDSRTPPGSPASVRCSPAPPPPPPPPATATPPSASSSSSAYPSLVAEDSKSGADLRQHRWRCESPSRSARPTPGDYDMIQRSRVARLSVYPPDCRSPPLPPHHV